FAVARRSNEQDSSFPGYAILLISSARCKELHQVVTNILLEAASHNQVVERCPLDILEEVLILVPAAAIKHQHFTAYLHVPLAHCRAEVPGDILVIGQYPIAEVPELSISPVHDEHLKVVSLPFHFEPGILDPVDSLFSRFACFENLARTSDYTTHY